MLGTAFIHDKMVYFNAMKGIEDTISNNFTLILFIDSSLLILSHFFFFGYIDPIKLIWRTLCCFEAEY